MPTQLRENYEEHSLDPAGQLNITNASLNRNVNREGPWTDLPLTGEGWSGEAQVRRVGLWCVFQVRGLVPPTTPSRILVLDQAFRPMSSSHQGLLRMANGQLRELTVTVDGQVLCNMYGLTLADPAWHTFYGPTLHPWPA